MLDYEIIGYKVEYIRKSAVRWFEHCFYTEEEAIDFVKANRKNWKNYRLVKLQSAIFDF